MAEESNQASKILQEGEVIKPDVNEEIVRNLAERLFGISCLEIEELNSYDDKNYKITEDPNMKNPLITNHCPYGYVLKIMNSLDSEKLPFIEAQTETMIYLTNHNIGCPRPIRNVFGHYFHLEKFASGKSHVIRLLEYQPGSILAAVPKTDFLFYQMGEFIAQFDRILKKKFYHTGYENHKTIWMLESLPELTKFKASIKEFYMEDTVSSVINQFAEKVLPEIKNMERGLIHGDFNEQNIIVNYNKESAHSDDWRVTGVIDFGDMQVSCYLFELAISMAYAMIVTKDIRTGGVVLAGYSSIRLIPPKEMKLLRLCVAARFVQSYVLGAYTHDQDPNNAYVQISKLPILELLPQICKKTDEEMVEYWKEIADDYLTKSTR